MAVQIDPGPITNKFREEIREWLRVNRPHDLEAVRSQLVSGGPEYDEWARRLHDAGLLCVNWPAEYGGRGLSGVESAVMNEEFGRVGAPRATRGMGEWLVGPSIIVHGTEEQKAHFLPRIVDGTDRYCQGFSEPDAGSDLAGLQTRGVVDGDEIVISGQKVWTSGAHRATMMFCLCRTDSEAPKHRGISYVLLPMRQADGSPNGVELQPIRQINGASNFSAMFITGARAPLFNVIGGLNGGWRVTMTTLGNERGATATTQHVQYQHQFWRIVDEARRLGRDTDPLVRQQLAWAYSRVEIMRYSGLRTLSDVIARREPGPTSSINKMFWSEYARDINEWVMNLRGADAMVRPDEEGYALDRWQSDFLNSRSGTIWGGTAQVQRNIVGERVLGLPKEARTDEERTL